MPEAEKLAEFFEREVALRATKPLRNGIQILLQVGDQSLILEKTSGRMAVTPGTPKKPDMSFVVPPGAVDQLVSTTTSDVGEIGVEIIKLMTHSESDKRVSAKVHIGIFDLIRNGYLGVLPLGGPTVMKYLASKGFTGMGKIKDAITKLRD